MRLTNMSFSMLYVGWLNYLIIALLPVTIACTILLYPVFSTNALVIVIFIMMYNILSMLFMSTIGTFFNHCKLNIKRIREIYVNDIANILLIILFCHSYKGITRVNSFMAFSNALYHCSGSIPIGNIYAVENRLVDPAP